MLTLSAYDADAPREGELVINGNSSIQLFKSWGVAENDKRLVDVTISTPASYWNDGENKLTFRHVRSGGYSVNEVTILFDGSTTPDPGPFATFSADRIDFGSQDVAGISDPITLTLTNNGAEPLIISDIIISSDFTETNNCSDTVPAGGNCIFDVQFIPKTSGQIEGALTLTGNTEDKYYVINLTGSGTGTKEPGSVSPPVDKNAPEIIISHDFNDDVLHTYTDSDVYNTWDAKSSGLKRNAVEIVRDPVVGGNHGNAMRVFFAANSYGGRNNSGSQWVVKLEDAYDELYFAYDVYFENDAEFVKGGKLPGLMSTDYYSNGGVKPDGTDRWTGGMVWLADGKISSYIYHANQSGRYGDHIKWNSGIGGQKYFQKGKWHRVELYYKMNTPGVLNGRVKGWLDGVLSLDTNKVMYRMPGGKHLDIGTLVFKTHYGGGNSTWSPSTDQHVYFDNFVISTQPITH